MLHLYEHIIYISGIYILLLYIRKTGGNWLLHPEHMYSILVYICVYTLYILYILVGTREDLPFNIMWMSPINSCYDVGGKLLYIHEKHRRYMGQILIILYMVVGSLLIYIYMCVCVYDIA